MDHSFSNIHPAVSFLYFLCILLFSMVFMHPICIIISLLCAIAECIILFKPQSVTRKVVFAVPMLTIAALINPAFNHEGATILAYFPSGNPLTLESLIYGLAATGMLLTVLLWCTVFEYVMTSDRLLCVLGKSVPTLSMVFSMVLRFVPLFRSRFKQVTQAQLCIGRDTTGESLAAKIRSGVKNFSIMVTWSLECAVETADSMKSRGYGLSGRTSFSIYHFGAPDRTLLLILLSLGSYIGYSGATGKFSWRYFPMLAGTSLHSSVGALIAYFLFCCLPIMLEAREAYLWKSSISKI